MDIFESLENLNVSEECFDEIMGIVEEVINESLLDMRDKLYAKHRKKEAGDSIEDARHTVNQDLANAKSVRRYVNKQRQRKGYDEDIDYEKVNNNVDRAVKDREELDRLHKLNVGKKGLDDLNPLTQKAQDKKRHAEDATIKNYEKHASGELKPALSAKGLEKLQDLKRRREMKEPSEETKRDFRLAHNAERTFKSIKRPHEKNNTNQIMQQDRQLDRNRDKGNYDFYGRYQEK